MSKLGLKILVTLLSIAFAVLIQFTCVQIYRGIYYIELSIVISTALLLPLRFFLDRTLVFRVSALKHSTNLRLFCLYVLTGAVCTFVFWGIEYVFHFIFSSDLMRYLGAGLGLGIAVMLKFELDERKIFSTYGQ